MTINDIIAIGRQIAAETAEGGNTAARVGSLQATSTLKSITRRTTRSSTPKQTPATCRCRRTTSAIQSTRTTSHTRKDGG